MLHLILSAVRPWRLSTRGCPEAGRP